MKINEIDTKRIYKDRLMTQINRYYSSIKFYGKCNNIIFMMIGQNAGVFDLDNNKFIISNRRGIAYPVVDKKNNECFLIINDEFNGNSYFTDDDKPKFSDTSETYMYDMDYKPHNLECFCNFFDENNINLQPINKYMSNIYLFTNLVYGDDKFKTIIYRDVDDDYNYANMENNYSIYDDLPSYINKSFQLISSSYAIKKRYYEKIKSVNKDSFNLDVVYRKWKYSVIDPCKGLIISYDNNVKNVEIVNNDVIMLTNDENKCALYDINKGYLVNFDENVIFNKVYKISKEAFILEDKDKYRLLINGHLFPNHYDNIYMISNDIIVTENFKKLEFYTLGGNLIFSIDSSYFYKCDDDMFYLQDNKFYHYNFKSGIKRELNIFCPFELEDGSELIDEIDNILQEYTHYYDSWDNDDFILFKEKKCGIEIDLEHDNKSKRWFSSKDERQEYFKVLLDALITLPINDKVNTFDVKKKIKFKH